MEIQHLRYFVAVARCGKIQTAADALFVSRQAVSKALTQLEQELGYSLFSRTSGGVTLSEQGQEYYERAGKLVQDFDLLWKEMSQKETMQKLRICLPFTTQHYFYHRIEKFSALHAQDCKVELISRTDAECHKLFEEGAVDMAVSHLRFANGMDDGQLVTSSPIYMAVNSQNPIAQKKLLTAAELNKQDMIFYMNGYTDCFWLKKGTPLPAYPVNDILLAFDLVHEDKGIFPVPLLSVPQAMQGITLVPYQGADGEDNFYCAVAAHAAQNKKLRRVCLALRTALAEPEKSNP